MHDLERDGVIPVPRRADARDQATGEQRMAGGGATERPTARDAATVLRLQRSVGNAGVVQLLADDADDGDEKEAGQSPVQDVVGKGGGAPLDSTTRTTMEQRFGADFSDVRVHSDAKASASASAIQAQAYTVGSEIVLGAGQSTGSPTGQRTLAHELTHVLQQRAGPVDGTDAGGGIRLSDPGDRFERAAEATASQVMAGDTAPSADAAAMPAVQRQAEEEEEELAQ